jgi:hypothetical protein
LSPEGASQLREQRRISTGLPLISHRPGICARQPEATAPTPATQLTAKTPRRSVAGAVGQSAMLCEVGEQEVEIDEPGERLPVVHSGLNARIIERPSAVEPACKVGEPRPTDRQFGADAGVLRGKASGSR